MTRFSLLRRAAVGTLAGVLACRCTTELAGAGDSAKTAAVTLNTGARMPALGFGTYLLTGDACHSAVLAALRAGYRAIDTAAGYLNEAQVADALEESGLRREEVFIASKLWSDSHGTEATRRAIRNTLRRLRTPYLDLYLIHAPDNQGAAAEEIVELRRQSWLVMEEEYRKGTLRAIGVCNFEPRHIEQLLQWGTVTPAVNQVECHPYLQQRELSAYCASKVPRTLQLHPPSCTPTQLHPSAAPLGYSPRLLPWAHTLLHRASHAGCRRRGLRHAGRRRPAHGNTTEH